MKTDDGMLLTLPTWNSGLLCDEQIELLAREGMIDPFVDHAVREVDGRKVLSFGLGSAGYDFRVRPTWKVFTPTGRNVVVDPKRMDDSAFVTVEQDYVDIPPNGFVLAASIERFVIPVDVMCQVHTKSTLARCGFDMQMTPLEPGWTGYVTVEIGNSTPHSARVYANEGIGQVIFHKLSRPCRRHYGNKNDGGEAGKYQDQPPEIVLPRL